MIRMQVVREIAQTYSLPPKIENRVVAVSLRRTRELGIYTYDGIYGYVANIVEQEMLPALERKALRLDRKSGDKGTLSLHQSIGDDRLIAVDPAEQSDDYARFPGTVYLGEAIEVLNGRLTRTHLDIFTQLAKLTKSDVIVANTLDEVAASADRTVNSLDYLAARYKRRDAVILPPRVVRYIQLNPDFMVKYGIRKYGADPLSFFLRNIDSYRGLRSQAEFGRFDPGIVTALYGWGQLASALKLLEEANAAAGISPTISRHDDMEYRWAHDSFGGDAGEAAMHLGITRRTLVEHWSKMGLTLKEKQHQKHPEKFALETV